MVSLPIALPVVREPFAPVVSVPIPELFGSFGVRMLLRLVLSVRSALLRLLLLFRSVLADPSRLVVLELRPAPGADAALYVPVALDPLWVWLVRFGSVLPVLSEVVAPGITADPLWFWVVVPVCGVVLEPCAYDRPLATPKQAAAAIAK